MTPRWRNPVLLAAALAAMVAVERLDYATGYEVGLLALYALPVAWIAWTFGPVAGISVVVLEAAAQGFLEGHLARGTTPAWIPWERVSMRFVLLAFIAFSFDHFRRHLEGSDRKAHQLQGILPICIACNRIRDADGRWVEFETYLREHSGAQPQPRLCPNCGGQTARPESKTLA